MKTISVVIPNYNGIDLLEKNIPPLIEALVFAKTRWEIIVVDDASTDLSVSFVKTKYSDIIVLSNEKNMGFAETINRGIFLAQNDIVMALNTDVTVDKNVFEKILPRFNDFDVFAVTPNIIDPRNGYNQAIYRLKPGFCWFTDRCVQLAKIDSRQEVPLFFSSGGSSCYDRQKLLQLGGFDPIYKPFYVEDVDLSYRAWKAGWRCVLEPGCSVLHEANTTISKYNKRRKIKFIAAKNKIIFLWLNISDVKLVFLYILFFLPSLVWDIVSFRKYKLIGTFMAFCHLPEVVRARRKRKALFLVKDFEIIKRVSL
ncbi:MAG: glycosyltransferase [Geobacter sp.]|nr:MAG: glycosyltransferase [Geobacter sp.]